MSSTKNYAFPLLLGAVLVAVEMALASVCILSAPAGMRWLGDTVESPSDAAVYLSYLKQGQDGHILLRALYAVEPHASRFDLVWSILGLVTRIGLDPVLTHEAVRWFFTLILALVVFAAARQATDNRKNAQLGTVLCFLGIGTGWIYSIWLGFTGSWTPVTMAAPDLVYEFALAPQLLAGAHILLSTALLITCLRLAWKAYNESSFRNAALAASSAAALLMFHPYFAPVVGVFCLMTLAWHAKAKPWKKLISISAVLMAGAVPALLIYFPLLDDQVFFSHHTQANSLPLPPPFAWACSLLPILIAAIWRWRKKIRIESRELWLVAWIAAVLISLLLPLPFKRKFTEGLNMALVLLTLPAWIAVRDWLAAKRPRAISVLLSGMLLLAAGFSPINLALSQVAWTSSPDTAAWFYMPLEVFRAWGWIHDNTSEDSVVMSDDKWVNVWIPAYAGRTVWVAHDHETPDFTTKRAVWDRLMATDDPLEARYLIGRSGVTHLLLTSQDSLKRWKSLLGDEDWAVVYAQGDVTVLEKRIAPPLARGS